MDNKENIERENIVMPPQKKTILEVASRILSYMFPPFIVPLAIFLWLFFCTYLNIMPLQYKLFAIIMVLSFTMLMPMIFIYLYQKINGENIQGLGNRKRRFIPYTLTIMGYGTCLLVMHKMHFPPYMSSVVTTCLICMLLCFLINLRWKISTHMAATGLLIGSLLSYSYIFLFNPIWWLCALIILSGLLGTARIIVKQHSLCEVAVGFMVGIFCGIIGILFI